MGFIWFLLSLISRCCVFSVFSVTLWLACLLSFTTAAFYTRQRGCFKSFQAPPSLELATHWVMKFMPSTPSATFG